MKLCTNLVTVRSTLLLALVLFIALTFPYCSKANPSNMGDFLYDSTPVVAPLVPIINEISGIADSKLNAGYLWGEEDSGNPPQLHLISHDGKLKKTIYINGATNRDWEDIALSGGKIYIGEIGDNNRVYDDYAFYCFNEPLAIVDTVKSFEKFRFVYSDGAHDAEAFLVDPTTKDIFIITKRDNPAKIYKLSYPHSNVSTNTASLVGSLPYTSVVSASLSPDGKEILVKTYLAIMRYERKIGESIDKALQSQPTSIQGYKVEPLGEAISFRSDGKGFFTLSEKGFSSIVNLYFYIKK